MSEQKHTPGPWHVGMRPGPIVYGQNGAQVADMIDNPRISPPVLVGENENRANARRIVACVNACEGISTEEAENTNVRGALDQADGWKQQRDELLAALTAIAATDDAFATGGDVARVEMGKLAREAVAKCKGA